MILSNRFRGKGLPGMGSDPAMLPSIDAGPVARLLEQCPVAAATALAEPQALAEELGIAKLYLKDERRRMGLGSFKALGAAYVVARDAEMAGAGVPETALSGKVYVAASAGNHGLSVAAGARVFGATAVVFLADGVPEAFAERLRAKGARVERAGRTYEDSMAAAAAAAERNGWVLLSDSSWPNYLEIPRRVMQGYLQMAAEVVEALPEAPTHVFLQAGVGGMAAAVAAYVRAHWGDGPAIVVVEPEVAPALIESIRAGRLVKSAGPASAMGRLDCKEPSLIALAGLARDADFFATITETEAASAVAMLGVHGLATTPSGAAGLAPLLMSAGHRGGLGLSRDSRVLAIVSEGLEAS